MSATLLTVTCDYCGIEFRRALGLVNRNRKLGMGTYCSLSHAKIPNPSVNRETLMTPAERLWAKVEKGDGCWLWRGAVNSDGYGKLGTSAGGMRTETLAHRLSSELVDGPIPAGLHVLHHCDTPRCVRPDHLFRGTHQDNMADMVAKGRAGWQRRRANARSAVSVDPTGTALLPVSPVPRSE